MIGMMIFSLALWSLSGTELYAQDRYADVKAIIDDACVVCHAADGPMSALPFETLESIKGQQDRMAKAIKDGRMPFGNPDFFDTPDGKRLVAWLENGEDLRDSPPPGVPRLIDRDPRTLRFADLESVIKANCQVCHAPGGRVARIPLVTLDHMRRQAKRAWNRLDDARMPPNDPNFAFTPEGRALMGWLRYGQDVSWRAPNGGGDDDGEPGDDD